MSVSLYFLKSRLANLRPYADGKMDVSPLDIQAGSYLIPNVTQKAEFLVSR